MGSKTVIRSHTGKRTKVRKAGYHEPEKSTGISAVTGKSKKKQFF
jgi:hypothetical protein